MREGIIASCSGNSDACCCRLSQWRQVGRDRAKMLAMQVYPSSALVSGTFVAAWKQPSGDINGTTHFRVEAGAVSGPPDSIHLSARQIGTFPVYSLRHTPHPARSLCSPSISLAALFPLPAPIKKKPRPRAPASAKHTPAIYQRVIFYGLSPLLAISLASPKPGQFIIVSVCPTHLGCLLWQHGDEKRGHFMESYDNSLCQKINVTSGKWEVVMRLLWKDIEYITDQDEGCDDMLK